MLKMLALVALTAAVCLSAPAYALDPGTAIVALAGANVVNNMVRAQYRQPMCRRPDVYDGRGHCVPPRRPHVGVPMGVGGPVGHDYQDIGGPPMQTGPKLGVGAEDFQKVEGIRSGETFDGVSKPRAAAQCLVNGGRLVAHFVKVMPNGQNEYHNTCE